MMRIKLLTFGASLLWSLGCDRSTPTPQPNEQRDTVFVRSDGMGAWGKVKRARSVLTITGPSPDRPFAGGRIAATPDGGVIVIDRTPANEPVVLKFDSSGRFVKVLGRVGSGPGEYLSASLVRTGSDGTVFVHSYDAGRVVRFRPDGTYLDQITVPVGTFVIGGRDGGLAAAMKHPEAPGQNRWTLLRIDSSGAIVDSIQWRAPNDKAPWQDRWDRDFSRPQVSWIPTTEGLVLVSTDRVGFTRIHWDRGQVTKVLVAEKSYPIVRYEGAERREADSARKSMGSSDAIPRDKEASYELQSGTVDIQGRIWIRRHVPGIRLNHDSLLAAGDSTSPRWVEPTNLVAFDADGTFLGELELPTTFHTLYETFAIVGDVMWAVQHTDGGEPVVVKFQME